jgi:hypothetical protein
VLRACSRAGTRSLARSSNRPANDCASPGNAAARITAKPLAWALPRDHAEQAGLADACLARDEQQPAFARRGAREPPLDEGQVGIPADQDR